MDADRTSRGNIFDGYRHATGADTMRRALFLPAVLAALALAACDTPPQTAAAPEPDKAYADGPGNEQVSSDLAAFIFKDACVDPYPGFATTPAVLTRIGMRPHAQTGTYYHPKLDLSVKLLDGKRGKVCSMVFASREPAGQLSILFSVVSLEKSKTSTVGIDPGSSSGMVKLSDGRSMTFGPAVKARGRSYYRAAMGL